MSVNRHAWLGGVGTRCSVCGSIRRDASDAGTPLGCIDRIVVERETSERRIAAVEDVDVIAARIVELRAERDAILAASS